MSTIHIVDRDEDSTQITLDSDKIESIEKPSATIALVRYKDGTAAAYDIGLDAWRRLVVWMADNRVEGAGSTLAATFLVRDCMSGVPYQLEYGAIKNIEWSPGVLPMVNRKATVYFKNNSALSFNVYAKDAEHIVNWLMSHGAIHGHIPERRADKLQAGIERQEHIATVDAALAEWCVNWLKLGPRAGRVAATELRAIVFSVASTPERRGFYDGPLGTTYVDDSEIVRLSMPAKEGGK